MNINKLKNLAIGIVASTSLIVSADQITKEQKIEKILKACNTSIVESLKGSDFRMQFRSDSDWQEWPILIQACEFSDVSISKGWLSDKVTLTFNKRKNNGLNNDFSIEFTKENQHYYLSEFGGKKPSSDTDSYQVFELIAKVNYSNSQKNKR